jgi:hypothetical protein
MKMTGLMRCNLLSALQIEADWYQLNMLSGETDGIF